MKKSTVLLLIGLLFPVSVWAEKVDQSAQGRRVMEISAKLRCAVCQSQSVAESESDLAKEMRAVIGEKLQQGESDEAVIQYFVDRYGDYILMSPPNRGVIRLLWWAPLGVLLLVSLVGLSYIRRGRVLNSGASAAVGDDSLPDILTEQQRTRLTDLRRNRR